MNHQFVFLGRKGIGIMALIYRCIQVVFVNAARKSFMEIPLPEMG